MISSILYRWSLDCSNPKLWVISLLGCVMMSNGGYVFIDRNPVWTPCIWPRTWRKCYVHPRSAYLSLGFATREWEVVDRDLFLMFGQSRWAVPSLQTLPARFLSTKVHRLVWSPVAHRLCLDLLRSCRSTHRRREVEIEDFDC